MFELLIATTNNGKILELEKMLSGLPCKVRGLREFPGICEVEETGRTFSENASIKAREYSAAAGLWALADDSGLEVAALGGAPGVYSARYGGDGATDRQRYVKLLHELNESGSESREARFVCAMAVADKTGEIIMVAEGYCPGRITEKPAGEGGFGYDPVFVPDGFELTFGELSSEIKDKISHRARAFEKIIRFLRDITLS